VKKGGASRCLPAITLDPCGDETFKGLDRFGRIIDIRWQTEPRQGQPTVKDRFAYGCDRNSNRLYRRNLLDANFSELYHANGASSPTAYDGLDRLQEFRLGQLNAGNDEIDANASVRQLFTLDALGNWTEFKDGNGAAWSLEQTRDRGQAAAGRSRPA